MPGTAGRRSRRCWRSRSSAPASAFVWPSGVGRQYLALWTVDAPQALATPQYVSQWGFAEWAPFVTDWSRDLFDGSAQPDDAFAVAPQGAMEVVSFDGMSVDDAAAARAALACSDAALMWLPVVGLDRHTPEIGLRPLPDLSHPPRVIADRRAQCAVYRPISDYHRAPTAA